MSNHAKRDHSSFVNYLECERESGIRHEYVDGQTYAMGGATELHHTGAAELFTAIHARLPLDSRVWMSDMMRKVEIGGMTPFASAVRNRIVLGCPDIELSLVLVR